MEMDFPDMEELEYLESNHSNFLDEFETEEFDHLEQPPSPPSEFDLIGESMLSDPQKTPTEPVEERLSDNPLSELNSKKRLRHDDASVKLPVGNIAPASVGKRSRMDYVDVGQKEREKEQVNQGGNGAVSDEDAEDWLRYSPPPRPETSVADVVMEEEETREKFFSRYVTEIEGDCVPVTGLDGERVYAKISRISESEEHKMKRLDVKRNLDGLISEPIRALMNKVEHDELSKALQVSAEGENNILPSDAPLLKEQLWVDKYAPNSFIELLSDEKTNREVALWLKQWDSCVFGSDIKSTTDDVLSALKRHSSAVRRSQISRNSYRLNHNSKYPDSKYRDSKYPDSNYSRGTSNNTYQRQENNDSKEYHEPWDKKQNHSGPPEKKIMLLCGPPGLGKTTLAHVAAKHCGYRVVEINASDDRSSSIVERKILDAVQMDSVIADSKPKCLVIDEIDGALGEGKGAIDIILKMVSADRKSDTGKENAAQEELSGRKSSRKKQRNLSLLRPVICICNDLYAPALRPLRQVAKVHVFVQPTVSRVVSRLKYICNNEGVRVNSIALSALVEYTECDIRSCLNTLQFLNRRKETLNMLDLSSQVVGQKDSSKSALDIWKEIFQTPRMKQGRKSSKVLKNASNEFDFLLSLVSNRGDYDLILDGIHENMLSLQYYDPLMQKTVKCLDKLMVSDIVHKYIMRTQHMSLLVYQPPTMLAIHGLIAQVNRPTIEWPKSSYRCRTMLSENVDILHSWHTRVLPCISRHLSTKSFVEDTVSPFLHILSPPTLKQVTLQLLSEKEKRELAQFVSTMVSYAITYKNLKPCQSGIVKPEDALDLSSLSFDPPVNSFINFKGYTSSHLVLASPMKQVLAHEVERQRILQRVTNSSDDSSNRVTRAMSGIEAFSGKVSSCSQSLKSCNEVGPTEKQKGDVNLPKEKQLNSSSLDLLNTVKSVKNNSEVRSPEKRKKPSCGSHDFFNRFRKVNANGPDGNQDIKKSETFERDLRPLLFKFNEGFTNAVKRPVRIREFFL